MVQAGKIFFFNKLKNLKRRGCQKKKKKEQGVNCKESKRKSKHAEGSK